MQTQIQEIPLKIKTFSSSGSSAFFKALGHPLTAVKIKNLIKTLSSFGSIAVYDPLGQAAEFQAMYDISSIKISNVYVQNVVEIGKPKGQRLITNMEARYFKNRRRSRSISPSL